MLARTRFTRARRGRAPTPQVAERQLTRPTQRKSRTFCQYALRARFAEIVSDALLLSCAQNRILARPALFAVPCGHYCLRQEMQGSLSLARATAKKPAKKID
jgi:hypothetical protein